VGAALAGRRLGLIQHRGDAGRADGTFAKYSPRGLIYFDNRRHFASSFTPVEHTGEMLPRQRLEYFFRTMTRIRAMGVGARYRERTALAKHRQQHFVIGNADADGVTGSPSISANSCDAGTTMVSGPGQNSSDSRCAVYSTPHRPLGWDQRVHEDGKRHPDGGPSGERATPRRHVRERGGNAVDRIGRNGDHGALE